MRFADPKLQLAMIDEVYRRRAEYAWVVGQRERYEATGPAMSWAAIEANQGEHAAELERFLAELPIELVELARIERLTLDGDRDLYQWVYPGWWDFGDHFAIRDLAGIDRCSRLEYLQLGQGLVEDASLAPIAGLRRLSELHLCARGHHRDIAALLGMPALRTLEVVNVDTSDQREAWTSVIAKLRARGVAVAAR